MVELESNFIHGEADWDIIKKIKENVNIPVIGNGDIIDLEKARKMFEYTNCDAIMIGRGALGNPWIFKEILEERDIERNREDVKFMILKHLHLLVIEKGEYTAIREMRKNISWYIKGFSNASEIRRKVNIIENLNELENFIISLI